MIITTEQLDGVRLTPHFTVGEFLNLKKYPDNIPTFPDLVNLYFGCLLLLEPARQVAGPIIINSGFRNSRVNRLVGGVENSQHLFGQAADIRPKGSPPKQGEMERVSLVLVLASLR